MTVRPLDADVPDIDWVEADGDYVRLHVDGKIHLIPERMHVLEETLDPARFVRIHRSAFVNLDRIRELQREPDGGGVAVLRDDVRLRVARSRWDTLEEALGLGGIGRPPAPGQDSFTPAYPAMPPRVF